MTQPQRRAKRVKAGRAIVVGFVGPGGRLAGYLETLSTWGLFLRGSQQLPPGTVGRLGLQFDKETIRIIAAVKNSVPGRGTAFEFREMGTRDREALNRLILSLEKESQSPARPA